MRRTRLVIALLGMVIPLSLGSQSALGEAPPTSAVNPIDGPFVLGGAGERIDSMMREFASAGFSGCLFVYRDGLVVLHEAYGASDPGRGIDNTVDTLFPVGSVEMEFLLAALLRLETDGRLTIDDSVLRAIEGARGARAGAGGAVRLAEIVEEASGRPVRQYIRQRLLTPAGMSHTIFADDLGSPDSLMARGRRGDRGSFRLFAKAPWLFPILRPSMRGTANKLVPAPPVGSLVEGDLGIWSTVGDLFRWRLALQGGELLGPESKLRFLEWTDAVRDGKAECHVEPMPSGHELAILSDPRRHLVLIAAANDDLGWARPVLLAAEKRLFGGSDSLLTFSVLAVCVAALFLVLGVTQRGKRGSFRRRERQTLFPF